MKHIWRSALHYRHTVKPTLPKFLTYSVTIYPSPLMRRFITALSLVLGLTLVGCDAASIDEGLDVPVAIQASSTPVIDGPSTFSGTCTWSISSGTVAGWTVNGPNLDMVSFTSTTVTVQAVNFLPGSQGTIRATISGVGQVTKSITRPPKTPASGMCTGDA